MARFGSLGTQYFDNSGQPLSGGFIEFFESGSSTAKTVYSDADQTIAHPLAVPLDAAGRQPDIYFDGQAKAVLKDSNGAQISASDPVGNASTDPAFDAWNALLTYSAQDIVRGSDDRYYQAVNPNLQGIDPVSATGDWQEIRFVAVWNAGYTYSQGSLAVGSNGALYRCINGNTTGDDPTSTPAEWSIVGTTGWNSLIEDITPQLGGNLDTNGFTVAGRDVAADGTKLDGIATNANNYTLPVASATLGGVKSGTDITVDGTGNVSVNDDSHNHVIANVDGLQTALDGKTDTWANWTIVQNGTTLEFRYNGAAVFEITSTGAVVAEGNITANGTA